MAGEITLNELLSTTIVTKAISEIRMPNNRFQRFFGMQPGGFATSQVGGRHFGWDIFNHTRTIAKARAPGSGPATTAAQVVGHVAAQAYRAHEKVHLDQERIFRTRPIGGQWGQVDSRGQGYVTKQERFIAQRFNNSREFMISRMLRGGFGVLQDGDDFLPVELGAGLFDVDYQLPDAHKSQLALLGSDLLTATWENAASSHLTQILSIDAAFQQIHGMPVKHIWLNNATLSYLLNSNEMASVAGSAMTIFTQFDREGVVGPDGKPMGDRIIRFRALPFIDVHVYDAVLDVNGTETKIIPDDIAVFMAEPDTSWTEWLEGSEVVAENVMDVGSERFGFAAWTERKTQPAGWELIALDNGLPALYIPKALAYGTVKF